MLTDMQTEREELSIANRYCRNYQLQVCNWVVSSPSDTFCCCCALNRKVPDPQEGSNFDKWQKLEFAKHRLVYQLILLGLPLVPKSADAARGLAFDFLTTDNPEGAVTGHANGIVTILLTEADSVEREQLRKEMSEPYRTLIGHFRHEIGHYYWPQRIGNSTISTFRDLFGDESADYGASLKSYYANKPMAGWSEHFISKYATSHPWEDWAETWAHYLHLMDTLETGHYSGIGLSGPGNSGTPELCPNPYHSDSFAKIFRWSVALTAAGNSLNRSMGLPDIYPFVIPLTVVKKLEFIHSIMPNNTEKRMASVTE